jgi:DNA-binding LacI/PurR family transcriptional regulator
LGGKQPTLHDVARLAKVSHQTVSRVINDSPHVADQTRERVLEVVRRLNYRPNRVARSLITGRSQTLQVINFDANYLTPLPPIITKANEHGYQVSVSTMRHPSSPDELRRFFDDVTSRIVDGFLLFAMDFKVDVQVLNRLCRGIPYVQLGTDPDPAIPAVIFDQKLGMQQVMQHLFDLGHREIAEVSGLFSQVDARIRHAAYLEMMEKMGVEPGPWFEGNFTVAGGYEQTCNVLNSGRPFTALVCGNDQMALGALRAIHEAGLKVPEDVSVVGFDDEIIVSFFEPPLTTVRQDFHQQAHLGIEYLIQLIDDPTTTRCHKVIAPELVIRQSTAVMTKNIPPTLPVSTGQ